MWPQNMEKLRKNQAPQECIRYMQIIAYFIINYYIKHTRGYYKSYSALKHTQTQTVYGTLCTGEKDNKCKNVGLRALKLTVQTVLM